MTETTINLRLTKAEAELILQLAREAIRYNGIEEPDRATYVAARDKFLAELLEAGLAEAADLIVGRRTIPAGAEPDGPADLRTY